MRGGDASAASQMRKFLLIDIERRVSKGLARYEASLSPRGKRLNFIA
jgi:hypothetical protein